MQRYYCPEWSPNSEFLLSEEESRHCVSVMRNVVGDEVDILDGVGSMIRARIVEAHPKRVRLEYIAVVKSDPSPNTLHIAISPTKNNDRFEWFLEKACEIGLGNLTPVIYERTERNRVNLDRWNKIIITSCKQSSQLHFPSLNPPISFEKCVPKMTEIYGSVYVAAIGASHAFRKEKEDNEAIIFIGPEGDFTEKERMALHAISAKEVSLSDNILRVETAGMVAATLWNINQ